MKLKQDELTEFLKSIDEIIEATAQGKMVWVKVNPTTHVYTPTSPDSGRVMLQRAGMAQLPAMLCFQVLGPGQDVRLDVSSMDGPRIDQKLQALVDTIEKAQDNKGLAYLKGLIPGQPEEVRTR